MTEEKESFVVDDEFKADWVLGKIQEARRKQKLNNERTEKMNEEPQKLIDANNEWLKTENSKLEESIEYFEMLLTEYMLNELKDNPNFKLSSPYGRVSTRKSKKWTYDDAKLVDEYKDTDLVKTTAKINKLELKKRIKFVDGKAIDTETGQVVDGVSVDEERKITIKTED